MDAATIAFIKQQAREAIESSRELRQRSRLGFRQRDLDARHVEERIEREHERALARRADA